MKNEWINERTNERTNKQIKEWKDERMNKQTNEWMSERCNKWMDEQFSKGESDIIYSHKLHKTNAQIKITSNLLQVYHLLPHSRRVKYYEQWDQVPY